MPKLYIIKSILIASEKRVKRNRGNADKKNMQSDYSEQIPNQCEEPKLAIEKPECENCALRSGNRRLREEVEKLREKYNELERALEERIEAAVSQAVAEATAQLYVQITLHFSTT